MTVCTLLIVLLIDYHIAHMITTKSNLERTLDKCQRRVSGPHDGAVVVATRDAD